VKKYFNVFLIKKTSCITIPNTIMGALSYFGIEFSLLIEYVNSKRYYFTKKLKKYSFENKN
jgi:hypothetical protein